MKRFGGRFRRGFGVIMALLFVFSSVAVWRIWADDEVYDTYYYDYSRYEQQGYFDEIDYAGVAVWDGFVAADGSRAEPMVAAGMQYKIALREDGSVFAWGSNGSGRLGDGTTRNSRAPVQVQYLSNVSIVDAGDRHSIALREDGTVWAWGSNSVGQLGDDTTTNRFTPVQVQYLSNVRTVAAGGYHSLALREDGTVWAWGRNYFFMLGSGQLGDGTTTNRHTPVQVQNLSNVRAVAAGGLHSLALREDGTVWAWGSNGSLSTGFGRLGDDTTIHRHTPVQVQNLSNVRAIAAGGHHSVALREDGTVWAWGSNLWGQLGDGTQSNRLTPVQVQNLSNVKAIAAGREHSMALREDGTVWTWGWDGTSIPSWIPEQVQYIDNVRAVAAGWRHSIALREDGTVWTWGNNQLGQLGDGTTTTRNNPVRVLGEGGVGYLNLGEGTTGNTPQPTPPPDPNEEIDDWLASLFSQASDVYNHELATFAADLSQRVYNLNDILEEIIRLGIPGSNLLLSPAYLWDLDLTAYVITHKDVVIDGITRHIILVTIRGTVTFGDWLTNFSIGSDGTHVGFYNAAQAVIASIEWYMDRHDLDNQENNIMLVTGHSKGGAVSNLIARHFNNSQYILQRNLHVYTFAMPRVVTGSTPRYNNIFNFLNIHDGVTAMPYNFQGGWGQWQSLGTDFILDMGNDSSHAILTYLNWMNSDPNMTYERLNELTAISRVLLLNRIKCPVDIRVYDSHGVLVGEIVDNIATEIENSNVMAFVIDDAKHFVLPYGDTYTMNFVATDYGTMTFMVEMIDALSDTPTTRKVFEDVLLYPGRQITSEITCGQEVRLFVTENGEAIIEINEDGTETPLSSNTIAGAFTLPNLAHPVTAELRRNSAAGQVVSTTTIEVAQANTTTPVPFTINAPPGTYTLIFRQPGHTGFTINNVVVPEDGNIDLNQDPRFPQHLPLHPGDVNGDGQVNISDLSILLQNWMSSHDSANLTGSGQVNISDLNLLLQNWMAESVVVD